MWTTNNKLIVLYKFIIGNLSGKSLSQTSYIQVYIYAVSNLKLDLQLIKIIWILLNPVKVLII